MQKRCALTAIGLAMVLGSAIAAENPEPVELLRLREQFQGRVEREIEPLRAVYRGELEKLEKRLIKENRLVDALTVKNERERSAAAPAAEGPAEPAGLPKSVEELTARLENSLWTFIAEVPNQPQQIRYVILLPKQEVVFCWNGTSGKWKATSRNELEFTYPQQNAVIKMKVSLNTRKWEGTFSLDGFARTGQMVAGGGSAKPKP